MQSLKGKLVHRQVVQPDEDPIEVMMSLVEMHSTLYLMYSCCRCNEQMSIDACILMTCVLVHPGCGRSCTAYKRRRAGSVPLL